MQPRLPGSLPARLRCDSKWVSFLLLDRSTEGQNCYVQLRLRSRAILLRLQVFRYLRQVVVVSRDGGHSGV